MLSSSEPLLGNMLPVLAAVGVSLGLAAGMGAGVGMYAETAAGVGLIGLCMIAVRFLRLGKRPHGETLVKFTIPSGGGEPAYPRDAFDRHFQSVRLIGTRSACDGERVELTYLVKPRRDADLVAFSRALSAYPLVEKATVIVCDDEGLAENVF